MKVESLISFGGRCEEALDFYTKAVGAEVTALMRWKESPDAAMKPPPGYGEKILHANFRIGETQLMADDGMGEKAAEFKGMTLAIEVADDAEAKRVFAALGEGGSVSMPLSIRCLLLAGWCIESPPASAPPSSSHTRARP